eukprot:GFUD01135966.1.p1 GENE.GFUD01135966.1~~GFUD01135966.1.p1  ORF type:complete len:607 (+),score=99.83 GFUD01135966.1:58-1878(+)
MAEGQSPLGEVAGITTTMGTTLANLTSEECFGSQELGVNVGGLIAIIIFYVAVLLVGIWASWRTRKEEQNTEQVMLAGRDIGLFVGVLTMGATWVGGGFINGSAQETYNAGLIWTQAPFGYGLSLLISGTFYARKMREAEYVTMVDPFTQKYGKWGALQALPAAVSEIFWSASILGALGSTLQVILNLDEKVSIIMSAVIALGYTLLGGLISVAYTDVIQIFFIVIGLFLALPFAMTHEAVANIYEEKLSDGVTPAWYGEVAPHEWGLWIDYAFLLLFGGIPWQCYYQRVLSSKTPVRAQMLSYGGAAIALIMTGPSVLFGAVAKATDWSLTDYPCPAPSGATSKVVLPLSLQYLTPPVVAFFGLGAVSAAVMSSTDSSMLSASTMIARNFYQKVIRPKCSEKEVIYALWVCICINCVIATSLAIEYKSIYELFVLCGDFMFVIVFPQLTLVLYWEMANTYGSVSSFFIGLFLRLLCGDKALGIPATISFGTMYGEEGSCPTDEDPLNACTGIVPFRLIVTIIGTLIHLSVSSGAYYAFSKEWLSLDYDFFKCFKRDQNGDLVLTASRHMETENYPLDDLKIPRPKVEYINNGGEEKGAYKNSGYN